MVEKAFPPTKYVLGSALIGSSFGFSLAAIEKATNFPTSLTVESSAIDAGVALVGFLTIVGVTTTTRGIRQTIEKNREYNHGVPVWPTPYDL